MAKKQVEAEVVTKPKAKVNAKKKRVLKSAPTLRDQAAKGSVPKTKMFSRTRKVFSKIYSSKIFVPFKAVGRFIRSIWRSKPLTPIRHIARWLGLILFPPYFRNSWKELQLVVWPDFKTTWRLTFAVIIFGAAFGLFIAGLDLALEKLFREVLLG